MNASEWLSIAKVWGAAGAAAAFLGLLIWRIFIPMIKKYQEDQKAILLASLEDARKERDLMRQLREREVDKFLDSLKFRDEQFKIMADAIRDTRRSR